MLDKEIVDRLDSYEEGAANDGSFIRLIMESIFEKEEMAVCNATGRPSGSRKSRPGLNILRKKFIEGRKSYCSN